MHASYKNNPSIEIHFQLSDALYFFPHGTGFRLDHPINLLKIILFQDINPFPGSFQDSTVPFDCDRGLSGLSGEMQERR